MAKKPRAELRAATPADAKAVWESFEKAGTKPTWRGIAKALEASGQFYPVHHSKIARWRKNGWVARKKTRDPAVVEAAAKLDAAVPVITGDPTTRTADLVANSPIAKALEELSTEQLIEKAVRENAKASIIIALKIQENPDIAAAMPQATGSLLVALSGSMAPTISVFSKLREVEAKTIEGTATEIAPEADPLADRWAEFDKAEKAASGG